MYHVLVHVKSNGIFALELILPSTLFPSSLRFTLFLTILTLKSSPSSFSLSNLVLSGEELECRKSKPELCFNLEVSSGLLPGLTERSMATSWAGPSSAGRSCFFSGVLGLLLLFWGTIAGDEDIEEEDEGEEGPTRDMLGEVGREFPMNGKRNVFCSVWWLNGDEGVRKGLGARNGRWPAAEGNVRNPGRGQKSFG